MVSEGLDFRADAGHQHSALFDKLLPRKEQSADLLVAIFSEPHRPQEVRSNLSKLGEESGIVAITFARAGSDPWDPARIRDDDLVAKVSGQVVDLRRGASRLPSRSEHRGSAPTFRARH